MKINKKIVVYSILFLLIGATVAVLWERGFFIGGHEMERSYKTSGVEPRYLRELNKPPLDIPEDYTEQMEVTEAQVEAMEDALNRAGRGAQGFDWFELIREEHIFLSISDLGNLRFTVRIDEGEFSVERGFDGDQPTMVVPLDSENVLALAEIFADGELTYEEQYRIYNILTVPALQALYRVDSYYQVPDLRPAQFDDFIQVRIPAEEEVVYRGKPLEIETTAVNVDGQWLVFPGLQGDPDWILSLDMETATELYVLGVYQAREANGNLAKLNEMSSRFLEILEENITYLRADHQ